jgi:hypothetical protein
MRIYLKRKLTLRLWRTLLTVLTVFSRDERIVITLLPARPSRVKAISIPSATNR